MTETIEIVKTIHGSLTEYEQSKEADMRVAISVEDTQYFHVYSQKNLYAYSDFSNKYTETSGDERAIDCIYFTGFCSSYPSDWSMKSKMFSSIAYRIKHYIKRYNWWFE